jgi:hypothetical protein
MSVLESSDPFVVPGAVVDPAVAISAASEQDSLVSVDSPSETASLHVSTAAANAAAATFVTMVSLAPPTGLQIGTPLSAQAVSATAWPQVAAQIFQALARTNGNDLGLASTGHILPVQSTADSLDPNTDEFASFLIWQTPSNQPVHGDPAAQPTPTVLEPQSDAPALDQLFAQTDDTDALIDCY